ncbi:hypothetical protein GF369_00935 [Candidatus Peregrinibacteria bacterium]|nr:hypothetical protein [Candidatus Peregrinibacteria bacterium]
MTTKKLLKILYVIMAVLTVFLIYLFYIANSSQTYDGEMYSFEYPNEYFIEHENGGILIVEGKNGRVEIFKKEEERVHGFSSTGIEEFEKELVPKEKLVVDDYEFWLFYENGDDVTAQVLGDILDTFETR